MKHKEIQYNTQEVGWGETNRIKHGNILSEERKRISMILSERID